MAKPLIDIKLDWTLKFKHASPDVEKSSLKCTELRDFPLFGPESTKPSSSTSDNINSEANEEESTQASSPSSANTDKSSSHTFQMEPPVICRGPVYVELIQSLVTKAESMFALKSEEKVRLGSPISKSSRVLVNKDEHFMEVDISAWW